MSIQQASEPTTGLQEAIDVCEAAARGQLERRLPEDDPERGALHLAINGLLDVIDAFVRERMCWSSICFTPIA